jgi:hypothetical protein
MKLHGEPLETLVPQKDCFLKQLMRVLQVPMIISVWDDE